MGTVVDFDPIATLRKKSRAHAALVVALGSNTGGLTTKEALADHLMSRLWISGFKIVPRNDDDGSAA
jgi:hypothetical protein